MHTCNLCDAYGEHLTLTSFRCSEDFLDARLDLADGLARTLGHRPVGSLERWLQDADELNERLREENEVLKARLASLGASQQPPPQPLGAGPSSHPSVTPADTFVGGRVRGTVPQGISTSHRGDRPHTPYTPVPRELSLTTIAPAPHEPIHIESDVHMDVKPQQSTLTERITTVEKTLDNAEGRMFQSFTGSERPSQTLVLGWADDDNGQVQAPFIRYQHMLYAFIDGAAQHVLRNLDARVPIPLSSSTGHRGPAKLSNNIMGPVALYNSAQELRELFERAQQEEPGNSPNMQHAQDLMSYLHLWNRWRMTKNELMLLTIKAWRPPAWAVERNKQKKAALKEKGKARLTSNVDGSTTPGELNPHIHSQTSPAVPTTPVVTGSISVAPTTTPRAPLEERITSVPAEDISAQEQRHIPTLHEALTTR